MSHNSLQSASQPSSLAQKTQLHRTPMEDSMQLANIQVSGLIFYGALTYVRRSSHNTMKTPPCRGNSTSPNITRIDLTFLDSIPARRHFTMRFSRSAAGCFDFLAARRRRRSLKPQYAFSSAQQCHAFPIRRCHTDNKRLLVMTKNLDSSSPNAELYSL